MARQVWVVRAGRRAIHIQDFLKRKMVAIGWGKSGDLTSVVGREQIAAVLSEYYPNLTRLQAATNASQVHRFVRQLVKGETVLSYELARRVFHIGIVIGNYEYRAEYEPDLRHTRAVEWLTSIERDRLTTSTKHSLGSISTIFQISGAASDEIRSLIGSRESLP
jgi:restriction system protein